MPRHLQCLIAGGDEGPARRFATWLCREGHTVSRAASVDSTVIQVARRHFDIVILDAGMGSQALQRALPILRGATANRSVLIYLLAGIQRPQCHDELSCDGVLHLSRRDASLRAQLSRAGRLHALLDSLRAVDDRGFVAALRADPDEDLRLELFALLARSGEQQIAEFKCESLPGAPLEGPFSLVRPLADGRVRLLLADHRFSDEASIAACLVAHEFLTSGAKQSLSDVALSLHNRLQAALGGGVSVNACIAEVASHGEQVEVCNAGMGPVMRIGTQRDDIQVLNGRNVALGSGPYGFRETRTELMRMRPQDRLLLVDQLALEDKEGAEGYGMAGLRRRIIRNRHRAGLLDEVLTDLYMRRPDLVGTVALEWRNRQQMLAAFPLGAADVLEPSAWRYRLDIDAEALRVMDPLPLIMDAASRAPGLIECAARFRTVLCELLQNALLHGLAGQSQGHLRVELGYSEDEFGDRRIRLLLSDGGEGFDHWRWMEEPVPESGLNGRGIAIVRELCEWVRYLGKGDRVEACFRWSAPAESRLTLPFDPPAEMHPPRR